MKVFGRLLPMLLLVCACTALTCQRPTTSPESKPRSYRLGFTANPPRIDTAAALQTIQMWIPRSDAAMLALGVPYQKMLQQHIPANTLVRQEQLELVKYYRARGLPQITVMVDGANGLARDRDADELIALGRSIREPAVQAAYREYVMAVDSILHPTFLVLALETNLIRLQSPRALYDALVAMTNTTAGALRAAGTTSKLVASVQVDVAWGRAPLTNKFVGISVDLHDFPFIDALGLSSYPYLAGFTEPEDIPLDYYARMAPAATMPMLVLEGGWTSGAVEGVTSSREKQARWIKRQMALADRAKLAAVFQIPFTDIAIEEVHGPPILALFGQIGLVDTQFRPKPALAEWDAAFHRPLRP